jgi:hypothetical protein
MGLRFSIMRCNVSFLTLTTGAEVLKILFLQPPANKPIFLPFENLFTLGSYLRIELVVV